MALWYLQWYHNANWREEEKIGPFFSVLLLLTIAVIAVIAIFAIACFFLPARQAILVALVAPVVGGAGTACAALLLANFFPATLVSTWQVLLYLGTSGGAGLAAAIVAGRAVMRRTLKG